MEAQIQLNGCAAEGFGRGKAPQDRITEGSQKPQQQIGGSQQVRGCPKRKFTVSSDCISCLITVRRLACQTNTRPDQKRSSVEKSTVHEQRGAVYKLRKFKMADHICCRDLRCSMAGLVQGRRLPLLDLNRNFPPIFFAPEAAFLLPFLSFIRAPLAKISDI